MMIWNCDLKFQKWNIESTRNFHIFKNSYLLNNDFKKTCDVLE
jgi:hypothetical protein